jgi:hypothetical protein
MSAYLTTGLYQIMVSQGPDVALQPHILENLLKIVVPPGGVPQAVPQAGPSWAGPPVAYNSYLQQQDAHAVRQTGYGGIGSMGNVGPPQVHGQAHPGTGFAVAGAPHVPGHGVHGAGFPPGYNPAGYGAGSAYFPPNHVPGAGYPPADYGAGGGHVPASAPVPRPVHIPQVIPYSLLGDVEGIPYMNSEPHGLHWTGSTCIHHLQYDHVV